MNSTGSFESSDGTEVCEEFSSLDELEDEDEVLVVLGEAVHGADEGVLHVVEQRILVDHVVHLLHFHYLTLRHVLHGHPLVAHLALRQLHTTEGTLTQSLEHFVVLHL